MEIKNKIFQYHAPCPECGSSDNLSVCYVEDEGHAVYCNSPNCDFQLMPSQIQEKYGTPWWDESQPVQRTSNSDGSVTLPEVYRKATRYFRGIRPETFNRFGVYLTSDHRLVFPYHDASHNLVGYKSVHYNSKDWRWGAKNGSGMFGVKCAHSRYRLFITEGEYDALSLKDLTGDCAVSISCGADSLVREYRAMIRFIESFDDVFVVMDNDEPGRKAAEDLKPHVDPAKVHFVQLPNEYKDINEMLQAARNNGDFDAIKRRFLDCVYASRNAVPENVFDPDDLADAVVADMFGETQANEEISTGIRELDEALGGWRYGELTTIIAPTSIGKSTFVRAIATSLINRGHKCMLFSLEEPPRVTVRKIVELLKGDEVYYSDTREQAKAAARKVSDYLVTYNQNGRIDPDEMKQTIDFAVRGQGVEFVILDNLTRAIDHSEPYNSINTFLDKLTDVTVGSSIHTFCVSHTKRTDNSTNAPDIQEARGSGLIEALSSNILSLGRNRNEHRTHVCLLKNREYGTLTDCYLDYNPETKRFSNMDYFDGGTSNGSEGAEFYSKQKGGRTHEQTEQQQGSDSELRAGTSGGEDTAQEQQPEGSVQTEEWEGDSSRQQGGGSTGTSDGGQRSGLPSHSDERASTGDSDPDVQQVPGLRDSNDERNSPPGSEGPTTEGATEENYGNVRCRYVKGVPILSKTSRETRQDDSFRWCVAPWYRPKEARQKHEPEESPNSERAMQAAGPSHSSHAR